MEANQPEDALLSPDGQRRAVVTTRLDGTFLVVFERRVEGDGLYEPKFYWSRESSGPSIVDTRPKALELARAGLGTDPDFPDEED